MKVTFIYTEANLKPIILKSNSLYDYSIIELSDKYFHIKLSFWLMKI